MCSQEGEIRKHLNIPSSNPLKGNLSFNRVNTHFDEDEASIKDDVEPFPNINMRNRPIRGRIHFYVSFLHSLYTIKIRNHSHQLRFHPTIQASAFRFHVLVKPCPSDCYEKKVMLVRNYTFASKIQIIRNFYVTKVPTTRRFKSSREIESFSLISSRQRKQEGYSHPSNQGYLNSPLHLCHQVRSFIMLSCIFYIVHSKDKKIKQKNVRKKDQK